MEDSELVQEPPVEGEGGGAGGGFWSGLGDTLSTGVGNFFSQLPYALTQPTQYPYSPYQYSQQGAGGTGSLLLIGGVVVIALLMGTRTRRSPRRNPPHRPYQTYRQNGRSRGSFSGPRWNPGARQRHRYLDTEWELRSYDDVWGNAKDGYEVNDSSVFDHAYKIRVRVTTHNTGTPHAFDSAYPSDAQIKAAFGIAGGTKIDTEGDDTTIYINRGRDSYPLGKMTCVSHASLSPPRKV